MDNMNLPGRGHNLPPEIDILPALPPEPSQEAVVLEMSAAAGSNEPPPFDLAAVTAFKMRVTAFADACGKWRDLGQIQNAEQSAKLTDFVSGARGIAKQIEDKRKSDKKVWDDKAKAVQAAYAPLIDIMDRALDSVKPMQADWLKRENERIAREKAEQERIARDKAAEAERMAAAAAARNDVIGEAEAEAARKEADKALRDAARQVSAKAGSATGGGRAMSLRKVKTAEIHSINGVYMHFREHPAVTELLQRLANEAVRQGVEFDPRILTVKIEEFAA